MDYEILYLLGISLFIGASLVLIGEMVWEIWNAEDSDDSIASWAKKYF